MNILSEYKSALSTRKQKALSLLSKVADDMDIKIYLVGGIVRDILLNRNFNDIDILLEYDAIIFAEFIEQKYPNTIKILAKNDKFKTAKLEFHIENEIFEADIASTRSEVYEYPSALPLLAETCVPLKKDILRRDFTVNALILSLNAKDFCEIYDETNLGLQDLKNKTIRILHPDSFMDDPSRILRGLKYRSKLDFILDEDTKMLQDNCLESSKFDDDCQDRIKKELIETLNINMPSVFDKFISEHIYRLIISQINKKNIPSGILINEIINNNIDKINSENIWLILLSIIFNFAPENKVIENIKKLNLTKKENKILNDFIELKKSLTTFEELKNAYELYQFLQKYQNESIIAFQCILKNPDDIEKIYLYFNKLINIKLSVTGDDIKKYGISNGIMYKKILNSTLEVKINNNLNEEEEKKYFKEICKSIKQYEKY